MRRQKAPGLHHQAPAGLCLSSRGTRGVINTVAV